MTLNLKRPLIVFDLETTGLSVTTDRIIELSYIKLLPNGSNTQVTQRFNPGIPIPPQASAIHGIYDNDVAEMPFFKDKAHELVKEFAGCDFGGYNSNKFDFPLLVEEFIRCGIDFDTDNRKFIDAQRIFHIMEPRTLSAAYKFYCEKELVNAHSAAADTHATLEILMSQIQKYPELKNDIDFLHAFSGQSNNVDLAGRIQLNDKKEAVFNFGKHRNKKVIDVFKVEPSYYKWMMDGDFALETKQKITRLFIEARGK